MLQAVRVRPRTPRPGVPRPGVPRRRTLRRWAAAASFLCIGVVSAAASCDRPATGLVLPAPDGDLLLANRALGDPYEGRFPIERALRGLPDGETLTATLVTSEGEVPCTLMPERAPLTVASFVGLARGIRPFLDKDGAWRTEPYYETMPWHRAQRGQFVQTGRRGRLAQGGYFLQDEVHYGDSFDRPGVLAMANTGGEHSGSVQFFVTTGAVPHLEGTHTIFGRCDGEAAVRRLERAVLAAATPQPTLLRIDITRH